MKRTIDAASFKEMLFMGAALLEKNKQTIDAMNVFPVPDGDTGTNMSMTMQRAVAEIKQQNPDTVEGIASALSMGALKGARGNSGVILSQIFRGYAKAFKGVKTDIDAKLLSSALSVGTEAAYKAVMKPREGTMLTVSRMISESVEKAVANGMDAYGCVDRMFESGEAALRKTPELLPVLKEAGVVDSGGVGLLTIYRGFKMVLDGEELDENIDDLFNFELTETKPEQHENDLENITYGYCTEFFVIHLYEGVDAHQVEAFREKLQKIGDSIVVVNDEDIIKVHVHSNNPGKVIQLALNLGEIDKIKIENMREQNRELTAKLKENEKEAAIVAVSVGKGIDEVFTSLGADQLISGGQSMNPSIDLIVQCIKKANARNVFVLPNNSNIIMAAQQAAEIAECNVIIIPTKTIVQGVSALMAFDPEADADTNKDLMTEAIGSVTSGSVTYAVRNTTFEGNVIAVNDIIGMKDGKICTVNKEISAAAAELARIMLDERDGDGVVTLYYGENVTEEDAVAIADILSKEYKNAEFIVQFGGQPLYYYYISVE